VEVEAQGSIARLGVGGNRVKGVVHESKALEELIRFYAVTDRALMMTSIAGMPPQCPRLLERDFVAFLVVSLCSPAGECLGDLLASCK